MRLLAEVTALAVVCLLLFILGVRYGSDAFAAGVGLTLAGGLVVDAHVGRRAHSRADDGGKR